MNCDQMMDLLQRQLDNDLTTEEQITLSAHLQQCPSCTDLHARFQLLSAELIQLPKVTPPWSIVDSILSRLDECPSGSG